MDSQCMDHYEKQLYSVFKTFDIDNEEALDKTAVLDLCDALQLEDRGATLVDTLFERPAERVTFTQFRNGLLSVLGAGDPAPPPPPPAPIAPAPAHSDDDSSGREVAPKFVFGAKKYGRRSRPPSAAAVARAEPQLSSPDQDRAKRRMKVKKNLLPMEENITPTSSPSEKRELDHDKQINYEQSLALCHSLHMDRIDPQLIRQIFNDATSTEISVGEFFDRLNTSLTMSIASTCDTNGAIINASEDCIEDDGWGPGSMISSDSVIDAWEHAGIEHSRQLLLELGFTNPTLSASDLSRTLDDELHAFIAEEQAVPDARALLLQAALVLQRLRLARARRGADAARAENIKLRSDLADANRRAQTLAQEVDENHARIESSLKGRIKQLEARHTEEIRSTTAEWTAERERVAQTITRLEESLKKVTSEESRLRAETDALRDRNEELSRRASLAEERTSELELMRDTLALELKNVADNVKVKCEAGLNDSSAHELTGKLEELRLENKILRDKNDELVAELEATSRGGAVCAEGAGAAEAASWREEAGLGRRTSSQQLNEDCDPFVSIDQKVVGHLEVVGRLQGILDTLPASIENSSCESCSTLKGIITSIQERVQELGDSVVVGDQQRTATDAVAQTENNEVEDLKKQLQQTERKHDEEKKGLSNLVRDLETSLDALKIEYDKCEEYWSRKLESERDAYSEEQRISDERLNELISKISEYEQQFAPNTSGTLPTIDESALYESQVNDLHDEYEKYKHDSEKQLAEKTKELEDMKEKLKTVEANLEVKQMNGQASNVTSPIDYLWNQGTISSPYKNEKRRDYHNPAFTRTQSSEEGGRAASDGERDARATPIQRPPRSASAGREPAMIQCAELEGQLRQQAQMSINSRPCACAALEARCCQLAGALRHRQMCLDAAQQAARSEGAALRARIAAAESGVSRLQARLAAADLLVKELYLENCQLTHQTRLL